MTVAHLMGQSAILTFLGMGVVFAFLAILVLAVELTAAVIRALRLDSAAASASEAEEAGLDARRRAAIAAALHEHARRHGGAGGPSGG